MIERVVAVRVLIVGLVAGSGCGLLGETEPDAPPPREPLNPLASSEEQPWLQTVWFTLPDGATLEGLTTTGQDRPRPVLTWVDAAGVRTTVQLDARRVAEPLSHRVDADSRDAISGTAEDGSWRVFVRDDDGGPTLVAAQLRGGARFDLVRETEAVDLVHPSVSAAHEAVYVEGSGAVSGIWRVALEEGAGPVRVVPEAHAATPVAWPTQDGAERLLYVDETPGRPVSVVVAQPTAPAVSGEVASPAGWIAADRLPGAWLRVVPDGAGGWLTLRGCDGAAGDWSVSAEGEALTGPFGRSTGGWTCGPGCVLLADRTEGGAWREVARGRSVSSDGVAWTWDLGPATPWPVDTRFSGARSARLLSPLDVCPPELPEGTWLTEVVQRGPDHARWTDLEVGRGTLKVHGTKRRGRQPLVVTVPDDGGPVREQLSLRHDPPDRTVAPAQDPVVAVRDGAVVRLADEAVVFTPPSGAGAATAVARSADGRWLAVATSGGPDAAVFVVRAEDGAAGGQVPGLAEDVAWRGDGLLAVLRQGAEGPALAIARPLTEDLGASWAQGPEGVYALPSRWTAVRPSAEGVVRCDGLDLAMAPEGAGALALSWGPGRASVPLWARHDPGEGPVWLLGLGPEGPRLVARLRNLAPGERDGLDRGVVVTDRTGAAPPVGPDVAWWPADQAEALPDGGDCPAP